MSRSGLRGEDFNSVLEKMRAFSTSSQATELFIFLSFYFENNKLQKNPPTSVLAVEG